MTNTNQNIQSVKLQRTFMLVIGGSGAEAMISNRRRTIDQFGSLEAMPLVRYCYLDTDPRWYEDHLSKVEQHVRISETEYVDIQFPGAAELYRGIRRAERNRQPQRYVWRAKGAAILEKITRARAKLEEIMADTSRTAD